MSQSSIKGSRQTTTEAVKQASQCCVGAGSGVHDPSCGLATSGSVGAQKAKECCVGYGKSGAHDPSCGVRETGKKAEECCVGYGKSGAHDSSCVGVGTSGVPSKRSLMIKDQRSVFQLVMNDHAKVNNLYQQFNATTNKEERSKIAATIIKEISTHSFLEESVLYPVLDKKLNAEGLNLHEHSIQEHQKVKNLLYKMDQNFQPATEEFIATLTEVMKHLNHHIQEEEHIVLPKLQAKLSLQEEIDLGSSWENRLSMGIHPTHPHPSQPTTEPMATMAAMAAKPIDAARDTARFGSDTTKTTKDIHGR